jgi:Gas vesicle synthesis protein GvpO
MGVVVGGVWVASAWVLGAKRFGGLGTDSEQVRTMSADSRARVRPHRGADQPSMLPREAAQIAPGYITEITGRRPEQITALAPTDKAGWTVEMQLVEDRRVPSTADVLALYEIELDAGGNLLAYRRTRRYMRGQTLDAQESGLDTGTEQPNPVSLLRAPRGGSRRATDAIRKGTSGQTKKAPAGQPYSRVTARQ